MPGMAVVNPNDYTAHVSPSVATPQGLDTPTVSAYTLGEIRYSEFPGQTTRIVGQFAPMQRGSNFILECKRGYRPLAKAKDPHIPGSYMTKFVPTETQPTTPPPQAGAGVYDPAPPPKCIEREFLKPWPKCEKLICPPYPLLGGVVTITAGVGQTEFFDNEQFATAALVCNPGFVQVYNNASRVNDAFDGQWPVSTSDVFHGLMTCREVADRNWEVAEYDFFTLGPECLFVAMSPTLGFRATTGTTTTLKWVGFPNLNPHTGIRDCVFTNFEIRWRAVETLYHYPELARSLGLKPYVWPVIFTDELDPQAYHVNTWLMPHDPLDKSIESLRPTYEDYFDLGDEPDPWYLLYVFSSQSHLRPMSWLASLAYLLQYLAARISCHRVEAISD